MHDWCLITDIDGTLTGEDVSTRKLRLAVLRERRALEARGARLYWAVATGRRIDSAREVLLEAEFDLDDFDGFVTSVGAELYLPERQRHARRTPRTWARTVSLATRYCKRSPPSNS